jgi:hypothetical protein
MPNTYARIIHKDGIDYLFDIDRLKTLSITKSYLKAGTKRRTVSDEFLHLEDGQPSMSIGDLIPRNATIIGATALCETPHSWSFSVFKLGDPTPVVTLPVLSDTKASNLALNEDIDASTVLLFKAEGTNIPFPRIMLELAWRL